MLCAKNELDCNVCVLITYQNITVAIWKHQAKACTNVVFRSLTFNEILDILEEDDELCDVYIEPPDVRELTDEDERPGRLSGNQLLAEAEIRRHRNTLDNNEGETIAQIESNEPPSKKKKKTTWTIKMEDRGRENGRLANVF